MAQNIDIKLLEDIVRNVIESEPEKQREFLGKVMSENIKRDLKKNGFSDERISKRFHDLKEMIDVIDNFNDEQKSELTDYIRENLNPDFMSEDSEDKSIQIDIKISNNK